jgi:hypothetical protein
MRKPLRLLATAAVLSRTSRSPAAPSAVSPHLKLPKGNPIFTDNGLTLKAEASYAGLGNLDTSRHRGHLGGNRSARCCGGNRSARCCGPVGAGLLPTWPEPPGMTRVCQWRVRVGRRGTQFGDGER